MFQKSWLTSDATGRCGDSIPGTPPRLTMSPPKKVVNKCGDITEEYQMGTDGLKQLEATKEEYSTFVNEGTSRADSNTVEAQTSIAEYDSRLREMESRFSKGGIENVREWEDRHAAAEEKIQNKIDFLWVENDVLRRENGVLEKELRGTREGHEEMRRKQDKALKGNELLRGTLELTVSDYNRLKNEARDLRVKHKEAQKQNAILREQSNSLEKQTRLVQEQAADILSLKYRDKVAQKQNRDLQEEVYRLKQQLRQEQEEVSEVNARLRAAQMINTLDARAGDSNIGSIERHNASEATELTLHNKGEQAVVHMKALKKDASPMGGVVEDGPVESRDEEETVGIFLSRENEGAEGAGKKNLSNMKIREPCAVIKLHPVLMQKDLILRESRERMSEVRVQAKALEEVIAKSTGGQAKNMSVVCKDVDERKVLGVKKEEMDLYREIQILSAALKEKDEAFFLERGKFEEVEAQKNILQADAESTEGQLHERLVQVQKCLTTVKKELGDCRAELEKCKLEKAKVEDLSAVLKYKYEDLIRERERFADANLTEHELNERLHQVQKSHTFSRKELEGWCRELNELENSKVEELSVTLKQKEEVLIQERERFEKVEAHRKIIQADAESMEQELTKQLLQVQKCLEASRKESKERYAQLEKREVEKSKVEDLYAALKKKDEAFLRERGRFEEAEARRKILQEDAVSTDQELSEMLVLVQKCLAASRKELEDRHAELQKYRMEGSKIEEISAALKKKDEALILERGRFEEAEACRKTLQENAKSATQELIEQLVQVKKCLGATKEELEDKCAELGKIKAEKTKFEMPLTALKERDEALIQERWRFEEAVAQNKILLVDAESMELELNKRLLKVQEQLAGSKRELDDRHAELEKAKATLLEVSERAEMTERESEDRRLRLEEAQERIQEANTVMTGTLSLRRPRQPY